MAGIRETEVSLIQIRTELLSGTYKPLRNRRKEIPKGNDKVRVLGIPSIKDRVVQGALKLILEAIFEAYFQEGSFGYRPKRTAHAAVNRVAVAAVKSKTRIIDIDLSAYFDNVRHHILLEKVAERAKEVTRNGRYTYIEYSRFADDLVILVDGFTKWNWLVDAAHKRLLEELEKLDVQLSREKSKLVDLNRCFYPEGCGLIKFFKIPLLLIGGKNHTKQAT